MTLRTYRIVTGDFSSTTVEGTAVWVDNQNNLYVYLREDERKRTVAVFRQWISCEEVKDEPQDTAAPVPDFITGPHVIPTPWAPPYPTRPFPGDNIWRNNGINCGCDVSGCFHTMRIGGGGPGC